MNILQRFLYGNLEEDLRNYFNKKEESRIKSFRSKEKRLVDSDKIIFTSICEIAFKNNETFIRFKDIVNYLKESRISENMIAKSIDILEEKIFLINIVKNILGEVIHFSINPYALDYYAKSYIHNYNNLKTDIINYIARYYKVNKELYSNDIANKLSIQPVFVNLILNNLEEKKIIKKNTSPLNGITIIYNVSDELKK